MADYHRYYVPGGQVFFTVVTKGRAGFLCHPIARKILGERIRECRARWPFSVDAIVLLPDHLHTLWQLPEDDDDYSLRWAWIKKEFTKAWLAAGGAENAVSAARRRRGDRGIWQPRFWEHQIKDEGDFEQHLNYIHYNPVKHGLVAGPKDWPHSSFRRWVDCGVYPLDWASPHDPPPDLSGLDEIAME
jgi:putative transposase